MHLLEQITAFLNSGHAGPAMIGLRAFFFAAFVLASLRMVFVRPLRGRGGYPLLATATVTALLALFIYQGSWQLAGFRHADFMRFMRSHSPRADAVVRRGRILDSRGVVLAEDAPLPGHPSRRAYPLGSAGSHVVGYLHPRFGLAGIEAAAEARLSGWGGGGQEIGRIGLNMLDHSRAAGADVRLTLDARLQRRACTLLDGRRGAVVILRPSDGAILTLASAPGFDPAEPGAAAAAAAHAPMLNRCLQGLYPPGSTFKIVMAALAAEQGIAPTFMCLGSGFRAAPDASPIRDSEYFALAREGRTWGGHGRIGLRYGFVHSSNVYFAQLGLACKPERFNALAERLRLRERVTVWGPGDGEWLAAAAGNVPVVTPSDRRKRVQLSIGQGELVVTPMHVALWTAVVASGGSLPAPHLDADASPAGRRVLSASAAATVADLMREAVTQGTGRGANVPGLDVCGKTGTAQAPGGDDHSWFTCFAPRQRPRLVVTVLVERGGYGSRSAVPVAAALLREADEIGLLRPGGRP